jgi:hypothetical protein
MDEEFEEFRSALDEGWVVVLASVAGTRAVAATCGSTPLWRH